LIVTCQKCGVELDDADQSTICPHDLIMPAADLAQKKAGIALMGKAVAFHHMPDKPFDIESIGWNGMITLRGMAGEFAPSLFRCFECKHQHLDMDGICHTCGKDCRGI